MPDLFELPGALWRDRGRATSTTMTTTRATIALGAPADAVFFEPGDVQRPFYSNNPQLLQALAPYLDAQTPAASPLAQVRVVIAERLRGRRPTVRSVAKELAMSPRSLQRLLAEQGTSFRDLLDDERNRNARGYLRATAFNDADGWSALGAVGGWRPRPFFWRDMQLAGRAPLLTLMQRWISSLNSSCPVPTIA